MYLPPVPREGGNLIHEYLIFFPVLLPFPMIIFWLSECDSLQDFLIFLGDSQQLSHALLSIQTLKTNYPIIQHIIHKTLVTTY